MLNKDKEVGPVIVKVGKKKEKLAKIDCSIKGGELKLKIDSPVDVNIDVNPKDILEFMKKFKKGNDD